MQKRPEEILGVPDGAEPSAIKKAYYGKLRPLRIAFSKEQDTSKKKSLEEKISILNSAYSILMNPGQRQIEAEQPSYEPEPPGGGPYGFWNQERQQTRRQTQYFDFQFSNHRGQGPNNIWDIFVENFFENPFDSRREISLDKKVKLRVNADRIFAQPKILLEYTRKMTESKVCPYCNSRGCPRCGYTGYSYQEFFRSHKVRVPLLHKHLFSKKIKLKGGGDLLLERGVQTEGNLIVQIEVHYPEGEIIVMGKKVLIMMKVPQFFFNGEDRVLEVFRPHEGSGGLKVKVNLALGANKKNFSIKSGFEGRPIQLIISAIR